MEKFWREYVRSTSTSITSGRIESTESHVILGGGVALLLLSAHRAVICAIAQLYCQLVYRLATTAAAAAAVVVVVGLYLALV